MHSTTSPEPVPPPGSGLASLSPACSLRAYAALALQFRCPPDQLLNFARARISLHPRQLEASAAARLCDDPNGPTFIGYGGARGGGKSHWLLSQIGADDCQRHPGLKCLLLRKVGKSNLENFEDLANASFIRCHTNSMSRAASSNLPMALVSSSVTTRPKKTSVNILAFNTTSSASMKQLNCLTSNTPTSLLAAARPKTGVRAIIQRPIPAGSATN